MADSAFLTLYKGQCSVPVEVVPVIDYDLFVKETKVLLQDRSVFPMAYFSSKDRFYILLMDEKEGKLKISSCIPESLSIDSMGIDSLYQFERDISERTGIVFNGHPYPKPLRRLSKEQFKFNLTTDRTLHDVNVGPIHAGIIEPGRFRFTCSGEKVISMEICLGYQHRGVERLLINSNSNLKKMLLCEQITGDSVIANSIAAASILEKEMAYPLLNIERALALELERIAMHFSDIAALCGDAAYQLGQTAMEPLRTVVVNSLQMWCGSRSGRSLVRPAGSNYRLGLDKIDIIASSLSKVKKQLKDITSNILSSPSLLTRLEGKCILLPSVTRSFAVRGVIAKASSCPFDIRSTAYSKIEYPDFFEPVRLSGGDLLSRLKIRLQEADQSIDLSLSFLKQLKSIWFEDEHRPVYDEHLDYETIYLSPVEGFRGTILHVAITDQLGAIDEYRIFDPSTLAWPVLAYVMRGMQISEFPLCNKSFNLSYLANDL